MLRLTRQTPGEDSRARRAMPEKGRHVIFCVLYGLIAPNGLHATQLLEWMLPGFTWLSPGSFVLGLVEAFLFGVYAGLVFTPIYNFVQRRCH